MDVDLISANSSSIVVESPVTDHRTTFRGSGLVAANDDADIRGTVTSIEFRDDSGTLVATITGISWPLRDLIGTLDDAIGYGDDSALMDLLEQNGEDTVDPGLGTDIVDASWMDTGFLDIRHDAMVRSGNGMRFDINGHDNTALITKLGGNGTTEIYDVAAAMEADGLSLAGTASNDRFNVTVTDDGWVMLRGGRGDDTFELGPNWGTVRLDYRRDNSGNDPTRGIVANLDTSIVSNDGFGGTDTIVTAVAAVGYPDIIPYGPVTVEIRGNMHADRITG